jgi:hypothetical protein
VTMALISRDVYCPTCKAPPGQPCRESFGSELEPLSTPHRRRIRLAAQWPTERIVQQKVNPDLPDPYTRWIGA